MDAFFATIEEYLNKLYAFIAKIFSAIENIGGAIEK